jgi:hypothetical protein
MIPIVVESPYAGETPRNLRYLRACMRDAILRGESPYASHGLYTQPGVLRDDLPAERELGIQAGFVWRRLAAKTVFYQDLGESRGMAYGRAHCVQHGLQYELRTLGHQWEQAQLERERHGDAADLWLESAMMPLEVPV